MFWLFKRVLIYLIFFALCYFFSVKSFLMCLIMYSSDCFCIFNYLCFAYWFTLTLDFKNAHIMVFNTTDGFFIGPEIEIIKQSGHSYQVFLNVLAFVSFFFSNLSISFTDMLIDLKSFPNSRV